MLKCYSEVQVGLRRHQGGAILYSAPCLRVKGEAERSEAWMVRAHSGSRSLACLLKHYFISEVVRSARVRKERSRETERDHQEKICDTLKTRSPSSRCPSAHAIGLPVVAFEENGAAHAHELCHR